MSPAEVYSVATDGRNGFICKERDGKDPLIVSTVPGFGRGRSIPPSALSTAETGAGETVPVAFVQFRDSFVPELRELGFEVEEKKAE